jgi:hypothetical protein
VLFIDGPRLNYHQFEPVPPEDKAPQAGKHADLMPRISQRGHFAGDSPTTAV